MAEALKVRRAEEKDNQKLLELHHRSAMNSSISISSQRGEDYFLLPSLQGEDPKVFVVEKEGRIIATMSYSLREVRLFGRWLPAVYLGGLKLDPQARSSTALYRMVRAMEKEILEGPAQLGMLLVVRGNRRAEALLTGRAGLPRFERVATFIVSHIIPLLAGGCKGVERAAAQDRAEIFQLLRENMLRYQLCERPEAYIKRIFSPKSHFGIENFFVRRKEGRIVAALSLWDPAPVHRTVVGECRRQWAPVCALLRALGLLPPPGRPLSVLHIRHLLYREGHLKELKGLARSVLSLFWPKYRLIRVSFHEKDPVRQIFSRFPSLKVKVDMYAALREGGGGLLEKLKRELVWEDMSLH